MALPTYVAAGTVGSGAGALTPGLPAGIAADDILILAVANVHTTTIAATLSSAESFAAVPSGAIDSGSFGGIHAYTTLFWRRYDGTGSAPTVADNGEANIARIYAFRGCETSGNPWDEVLTDGDNDGDLTLTLAQSGNTLGDERLVVSFFAAMTGGTGAATLGSWTNADLANITEIDDQDLNVATVRTHLAVVSGEVATADTYGNTTAAWSGAPPYAVSSGVTIALKPTTVIVPTLAEGTTLEAMQSGSLSIKYTVAIEGYPYLLTDATPQQAVDAWFGDPHYATALGGLFVDLENEQTFDPWNPFTSGGRCTLRMVPTSTADTFGVDTHKRNAGVETELRGTAERDTTTITVATSTNFGSSGEAHIGTECIGYSGVGSGTLTGVDRGKYVPFANGSDGVGFAGYHRVGAGQYEVNMNPAVTADPRVWIGKWVGVWMHKYDASIPALNAKSDALCVYAGRIVAISDDGGTGSTTVELKHVLDVVADGSVGSRDQWTATVREKITLQQGAVFRMRDYQNSNTNTNVVIETSEIANDLEVVASGASGPNQINAGNYSFQDLFTALNAWWRSEEDAGRLFGFYSIGFFEPDDGEKKVYIWWSQPGAGASVKVRFEFGMPGSVSNAFGYERDFSEPVAYDIQAFFTKSAEYSGDDSHAHYAKSPLVRQLFGGGGNWNGIEGRIYFDNEKGAIFDQYQHIPSAFRPEDIYGAGDWGLFQVNNRFLIVGRYQSGEDYLENVRPVPIGFGFEVAFGNLWYQFPDSDMAEKITLRQVAVLEMPLGDALKRFLKSTGTSGYNDATYDTLGYGLGLAIPHDLTGSAFLSSIDALPHADKPIVVVLDRAMRISDLFHGDLVLRRSFLRWKQGGLEFATLQSPTSYNSLATLTESNKAAPSGMADHHRSVSVENGSWAKSVVKVLYSRTSSSSSDSFRDSITFVDKTSLDDLGGEGPTITIKARNTYGEAQQTGASIDAIVPGFVASLPLFSRPVRINSRSIDQRYFETLSIGDVITITDEYARDPDTGRRGIATRHGVVTKIHYTPGGLLPGQTEPNPQGGGVDVLLLDLNRVTAYAPTAQVDDTAATGGYNAGTKVLTLYPSKFSSSDVAHFAIGDKVRVIERDPADPTSPLMWDDTIAGKSGNTVTLTTGLAGWDDTLHYYLTFDTYDDAVATQQALTFQADDADAMIVDERSPMMYGFATAEPSYVAWTGSDDVELPANACYGDGVARDTGHDGALIRLTNNIINYKSAISSPLLYNDELGGGSWGAAPVGSTYRLEACEPIHLSEEVLLNDVWRRLHVAPFMKSSDGASATVRVTLSRTPPGANDDDLYDVSRGAVISEATFTTTSTTYATPTSDVLVCNVKNGDGNAWLYIETTEKARTRGLGLCQEGPRLY